MLSISTSWNHQPDTDMRAWLKQIREIGLDTIELGYTLTQAQVDQIVPALKDLGVKVSSIHNFCPVPSDEPSPRHPSNYYRLSSLDAHERDKAVEWTCRTVDLAKRVGAGIVVIHAGTLDLNPDPSREMIALYKQEKTADPRFAQAREELTALRAKTRQPYLDALHQSLQAVMDYAERHTIKVGLETRYYPIEIPNFEEIKLFLDAFAKQGMVYWHDVGHAEVNERLGLRHHADFLETYKDHLRGVHLHGVRVLRDHLAPFDGDMDLEKYLPYFKKKDCLRVIEARYADLDQIKNGIGKLKKFFSES